MTAEVSSEFASEDIVMQDPFGCGPTKVYSVLPTDTFGTLDSCWTERILDAE